jgi:tRNA dimethylallyltransferase
MTKTAPDKAFPMGEVFYIAGATASGKTDLAVMLAQALGTEVISCDSRQLYRELRVGSAPPSAAQLATVAHHQVLNHSVEQPLNAAQYAGETLPLLLDVLNRCGAAVVVGGSPLYAQALLQGLDPVPAAIPEVRDQLNRQWMEQGLPALVQELQAALPQTAANIDLNNPRRVIRALEIFRTTGQAPESFYGASDQPKPWKYHGFITQWERAALYQRINLRVETMMLHGLESEARGLYPLRHLQALQTVGYRELFDYFDGTLSLEQAVALIQQNTRNFAKRQLTWYRKDASLHPLNGAAGAAALIPEILRHVGR